MTDEKLKFANLLKAKIDKLDDEIYLLMDLTPPVRSARTMAKGKRGKIIKIKENKIVNEILGYPNKEIELSNEDGRALIDIRTAEREALKQVLDELE